MDKGSDAVELWKPNNSEQERVRAVSRDILSAQGFDPDAPLAFIRSFDWRDDGGSQVNLHERPAWTGARAIRIANAAIRAMNG